MCVYIYLYVYYIAEGLILAEDLGRLSATRSLDRPPATHRFLLKADRSPRNPRSSYSPATTPGTAGSHLEVLDERRAMQARS